MNTEDFVTYEQALALKKLGFNKRCLYYYNVNEQIVANERDYQEEVSVKDLYTSYNSEYTSYNRIDAPTLAQAQKWLRDMKRLSIEPYANIAVAWNYNIANLDNFAENVGGEASFPSYESALSAGIAAALELIEKKGE